jgi:hypothetical protein
MHVCIFLFLSATCYCSRTPLSLLQDESGYLSSMVQALGPKATATLMDKAKEADSMRDT